MRKLLIPSALFALAAALTATAQPPAPPPRPGKTEAPPGIGPDDKPADAKPKEKEGPSRLERIKQLQFDRRPSVILKAWAPEKKDDKPAPAKDPKTEALDKELAEFGKHVTLGNWTAVKAYIASLPDEEAVTAYRQLLQGLQRTPSGRGGMGGPDMDERQM